MGPHSKVKFEGDLAVYYELLISCTVWPCQLSFKPMINAIMWVEISKQTFPLFGLSWLVSLFDSILWLLLQEMWMAPKDNDLFVVGKVLADVCVISGEQDAVSDLKDKRAALLKDIEVASLLDQIYDLKQSLKEAEANLKILESSGQEEKGEATEPKAKKFKGEELFEPPEKPSKEKQLENKEVKEAKEAMKPLMDAASGQLKDKFKEAMKPWWMPPCWVASWRTSS